MAQQTWEYRIEAYHSLSADWGYERTNEANADTWFLFGDKGDDSRVFGVFSSRSGAEDTANKLANGRLGEHYRGVVHDACRDDFEQALADAAKREPTNDNDKEIER